MTQHDELSLPYSAEEIRHQEFSHRIRGLDEYEVREFLDVLADQVRVCERVRAEDRAEIERLRAEVGELRRAASDPDEVTPQAVILFSQAQQVADQLVEEAVRHARDLMTAARNQQREILERAHEAADTAARGIPAVRPSAAGPDEYTASVEEIEYVRTFAHVAQVQLRSVVDALSAQVDKLGEVRLGATESQPVPDGRLPGPAASRGDTEERVFVYPRPLAT